MSINLLHLLNLIHLFNAFFAVYCIKNDYKLILSSFLIVFFCTLDYILYFYKLRKMTNDIFIHHIYTILIGIFFYNHYYNLLDETQMYNFIKNVLSIEVSNIFLCIHQLLKDINSQIENEIENELDNVNSGIIKYVNRANQALFMSTFVYFRIYHYTRYVVFSSETTMFIINISKNNYHTAYAFIGIYGLFSLNIYWFCLMIKKVLLEKCINTSKKTE